MAEQNGTRRHKLDGIPGKVLDGLAAQAKRLGLLLTVETGNARCHVIEPDSGAVLGGPFTHGQSGQSFFDGYRMGSEKGKAEGFEKGKVEGAKQATPTQRVHVVKTGSTFHAFLLVNNQWQRVEHPGNPAFNMEGAVSVAVKHHGLTNFSVEFADRTDEVHKKQ